jgi:hypothetical protein
MSILIESRAAWYRGWMSIDLVTPFARVDHRNDQRIFGIKRADRRYHVLTIGRTGTGKSTLLAHLINGDLNNGEGLAVLDPHGDLAAAVWKHLPRWRRDVIVFDPGDPANRLTFNPLHVHRPDQRHLVVSELITVFKHIWEKAWGPRLEYILRNVLLTLTERQGFTLIDALRLLNDSRFRSAVVSQLQDPILKAFWSEEFDKYSKSYRTEAIAPIQNKLGEFLINPVLRKVFDHPTGDIDPRAMMDKGRVFIASLSVGKLGRDATMLLGATLIGKFALAALSRSDLEPDARRDFYLYVDEFAMFTTTSIETILSEARKYRLSLILAMQYLDQLSPKLLGSVLGNVGNLIAFRVGVRDAAILAREFSPVFSADDLANLPHHHIYVRMIIDGKPAKPFSARVLSPNDTGAN